MNAGSVQRAGRVASSSDPFARVAFLNYSQATEKLDKTLNPTWDQTLIFDSVDIYGEPRDVAVKPPPIIIEVFDHDPFVRSFTCYSYDFWATVYKTLRPMLLLQGTFLRNLVSFFLYGRRVRHAFVFELIPHTHYRGSVET